MITHDLKTERREVSPGLPNYFRIAPIAFYVAAALCIGLSVWFYLGFQRAEKLSQQFVSKTEEFQAKQKQVSDERENIETLNQRATEVAAWVEGAINLQPLCVALSRSVDKEATIAEILMARNGELPAQIHLTLKMDAATAGVMDETLDNIRDLDFRAYSAQQTKQEESVDYKATLVWQNVAATASRDEQ